MSESVAHHPSDALLLKFVRRELPVGPSVAISAHAEMCGQCRARIREMERESGAVLDWAVAGGSRSADNPDFSGMIDGIVSQPRRNAAGSDHSESAIPSDSTRESTLKDELIEHSRLPRVLRRAAENLRWNGPTAGIRQANVAIDHETRCEFIHMAAGASTPVHTHYGREYTLLLDGGFDDKFGSYREGDFIVRDGGHEHQPVSENGCLCFAALDRPVRFTEGVVRLLNPINRLRFRDGMAR